MNINLNTKLTLKSEKDTEKLAKLISKHAFKGEVVTLNGDLGAGKTCLTKYVGKSLGVKSEINSPTFNILKCYYDTNSFPLYHIDAYRLEDVPSENKNIGLEEIIEGDGIVLIEWPIFIKEFIDFNKSLNISIKINEDNSREFVIESKNNKFSELFNDLNKLK